MSIDRWFEESREAIARVFGDDEDMFCKLLAATSPLSTIETNVVVALRAYRILKLDRVLSRGGFINTHYVCILKIMRGDFDLLGRKVYSLYQNLKGNENVVPVDRWVLRYYGYHGRERVDKALYDIIETDIAREAAGMGITPGKRQVMIWCEQRGSATSYGDIIRKKELDVRNILGRLL